MKQIILYSAFLVLGFALAGKYFQKQCPPPAREVYPMPDDWRKITGFDSVEIVHWLEWPAEANFCYPNNLRP